MLELRVTNGPHEGEVFSISSFPVYIGSDPNNDIYLKDKRLKIVI